ncbi:MAG TPA: IclR family transcriptional regulator [Thermomicrobiales bacterium]|jgi:IclR family acetate operon transcriptional repressor|nr:IclR family transcriptional regulator [Thermomicrobiales bacterium]
MSTDQGGVQSVRRALAVLEAVAAGNHAREETGIVTISRRCDLPMSTTHRLLATLIDAGFAAQDPETGHYRIGLSAFEVGNAYLDHTDLRPVARPYLRDLAELTGETVNLAIRDGHDAVYIDQLESTRMLKMFARPGARAPLACTGVGKVLLSGLSPAAAERILTDEPIPALTPRSVTEPAAMLRILAAIREDGHAVDDEEVELGVRCVAAPIVDHRGELRAAISVSGPTLRMRDDRFPELIRQVRGTAAAISAALGRGDQPVRSVGADR